MNVLFLAKKQLNFSLEFLHYFSLNVILIKVIIFTHNILYFLPELVHFGRIKKYPDNGINTSFNMKGKTNV